MLILGIVLGTILIGLLVISLCIIAKRSDEAAEQASKEISCS